MKCMYHKIIGKIVNKYLLKYVRKDYCLEVALGVLVAMSKEGGSVTMNKDLLKIFLGINIDREDWCGSVYHKPLYIDNDIVIKVE